MHELAIEIHKKTGSLSKLQTAIGHSSTNLSLTYLRGLEIAELREEDYTYGLGFFMFKTKGVYHTRNILSSGICSQVQLKLHLIYNFINKNLVL